MIDRDLPPHDPACPLCADVAATLREAGIAEADWEAAELTRFVGHEESALPALIRRRLDGELVQLITGEAEFMGVRLRTLPGTLVPRKETELLGATALAALKALGTGPKRLIDMCCGVGNLAVALAVQLPNIRVWASDYTDECVAGTVGNIELHSLESRVTAVQGDLFERLRGLDLEGSIDVIVANPPYISSGRLGADRADLLRHEPREAFDAGPYGIAIHQRLVREAPDFLRPRGTLLMELGAGQGRQVRMLLERTKLYRDIQLIEDGEGVERVAVATLASSKQVVQEGQP